MRVAVDATPLVLSSGGLRRYVEGLSVALAKRFPDDTYTLVSDQNFVLPAGSPANLHAGRPPRTKLEGKWWLAGSSLAVRASHSQLFHGSNFEVPYLGLYPAVITIHDLSPWKEAAWNIAAARVKKRTPWLLRMGLATMIITPSEAVRKEAIEFFHLQPERVVVTHLAAHPPAAGSKRDAPRPYILYVGAVEPRKNLAMLLDAWREVRKTNEVDLVIAGRAREGYAIAEQHPGLRVLGEVGDLDLGEWYAGASAFVYVSHYEGFGLPVLEAMQHGLPVITSRDPALTEVAGEAALQASSAGEISQMLRLILGQADFAEQAAERSRRRAGDFSWARTAEKTREVYAEALRRFG